MSQDQLARKANISSSAIYRIERREREQKGTADVNTLVKIAKALNCSIGDLFAHASV